MHVKSVIYVKMFMDDLLNISGTSPSPVTNICPPVSSSEQSHSQERSKMPTAVASTAPEIPDFSRSVTVFANGMLSSV